MRVTIPDASDYIPTHTHGYQLLQVLGYEVDAINSVQFCNHTQYKHVTGQILKNEELRDLFSGLEKNELLGKYSHLLTGR